MWQPLFANLALVAMALVAWISLGEPVSRLRPPTQRLVMGMVMAVSAVGSMTMAFEVAPGVFQDLRGPIIVVSGFFGGVPAAALSAGAALAYRFYLGGAVEYGALSIAIAAAIGIAGFAWRRSRAIGYGHILVLGLGEAVASQIVFLAFPAKVQVVLLPYMPAASLLALVATVLLGTVFLHETRRRDLQRDNHLYRSMVDALPDCLNIKDGDGRFLAANPATATLMRASGPEDLTGKTDFDFYAADLARAFREDELAILRSGEHATIEQPGHLPDGTAGWLSTLKVPIVGENGEVVALVTHNRDITAQKTLRTKLAETQGYLDQALDHMNDGLAMYDSGGTMLFCNDRYRGLFPRTAHLRIAGSHFADIIRASVDAGEEPVPAGKTFDEHAREKLAALRRDGEQTIELADGRIFLSRTKVLPNGCTLRMMADVTERTTFERELARQALHDPLTGLPNRAFFNRELDRLLDTARTEGSALVVMLLDLDRFKEVNDSFGHAVGDRLLVEVSVRLQNAIRDGDFVARLGGDEFAILMPGPIGGAGEISLATRVIKNLAKPLNLESVVLLPGGSIGYTVFPKDNSGPEDLLKNADKALYQAKARGRGGWKAFDPAASSGVVSARAG